MEISTIFKDAGKGLHALLKAEAKQTQDADKDITNFEVSLFNIMTVVTAIFSLQALFLSSPLALILAGLSLSGRAVTLYAYDAGKLGGTSTLGNVARQASSWVGLDSDRYNNTTYTLQGYRIWIQPKWLSDLVSAAAEQMANRFNTLVKRHPILMPAWIWLMRM
jgi:hypothetical protein